MINDSEISGAMAEGIERVSNLITRYAIFEMIYLRATLTADVRDGLRESIIKLYAVVLEYLCKARRYYGYGTGSASAQSPVSAFQYTY